MSLLPDHPDWLGPIISTGHQLIRDVGSVRLGPHTYGPLYCGNWRSLLVQWSDSATGPPFKLAATFYEDSPATIVTGTATFYTTTSMIVDLVPVMGNYVSFVLTGPGNPPASLTILVVDALQHEAPGLGRFDDDKMLDTSDAAVANNASVSHLLSPVYVGPAQLATGCTGGAHIAQLQHLTAGNVWRTCGAYQTTSFWNSARLIVPPYPTRVTVTNVSGAAATLDCIMFHDPD